MTDGMWVNPKIAYFESKLKEIVVKNTYYNIFSKKLKRERNLQRFVNERIPKLYEVGATVLKISDVKFNICFMGTVYQYNPKKNTCYISSTGVLHQSGWVFIKNKILNNYA